MVDTDARMEGHVHNLARRRGWRVDACGGVAVAAPSWRSRLLGVDGQARRQRPQRRDRPGGVRAGRHPGGAISPGRAGRGPVAQRRCLGRGPTEHTTHRRSSQSEPSRGRRVETSEPRCSSTPPAPGRLTLGAASADGGRSGHSVLVVGPTQSRKTSGLACPPSSSGRARWWRRRSSPTSSRHTMTGVPVGRRCVSTTPRRRRVSPAPHGRRWPGVAHVGGRTHGARRRSPRWPERLQARSTDGDFWYATAAKLLAPLLFAAATGRAHHGRRRALGRHPGGRRSLRRPQSRRASRRPAGGGASWGRDERQRSAVYTTAETVVEAFADPAVAARLTARRTGESAVDGRHRPRALCSTKRHPLPVRARPRPAPPPAPVRHARDPGHRRRLHRAGRQGRPSTRRCWSCLDEAANVAPLAELDVLASTAAGHGVQLVTVWQDLAQIQARYGERAGSVVNNHRAKVFLSGIADPATLEHASALIGEAEQRSWATTSRRVRRQRRTPTPRLCAPGPRRRAAPHPPGPRRGGVGPSPARACAVAALAGRPRALRRAAARSPVTLSRGRATAVAR